VPLLLFVLLLPLLVFAFMPLILIQRYRGGTARRLARRWVVTVNLAAMTSSVVCFLIAAAVTTAWIAGSFSWAVAGLIAGLALGIAGLWLSRWESTPRALYYTPQRWLVLAVTLAIGARTLYGLWRGWSAVQHGGSAAFVDGFGVPGSLAVGGIALGYYLAYHIGLWRRLQRWLRRPLRPA
jgi:hypothetical protein